MECNRGKECPQKLDQDIGFLVKQIAESIRRNVDNGLNQYALTMTQSHVLFYMYCNGKTQVSQKDIERHLRVTHPTVVGIIQRLEEKGFVITKIDGKDHRVRLVELTEQSKQLISSLKEEKLKMEQNLISGLSKQDKEELIRLLLILRDNVKEDN